ncbi:MAG TPA: molecular chaperone TorD family protein [Acidimicrobiia bacterium]|nr:molecular chaperone TorD family protein [Acidimicrobiia bacterium]
MATGFAFPTEDRLERLESALIPAASVLETTPEVDAALAMVRCSLLDDVDALREQHVQLFPPIASQDAPGYETGYRGDGIFQQTALIADIAGFYRAHGLRAGGEERERPDHVVTELEFMAVVAKKEAMAMQSGDMDNASVCRHTSAAFLRDHLGCWATAFGWRAATVSSSPWYAALGELLAVWVPEDMDGFGVEPVEVVGRPLPQDPPDDGACGPCPAPQAGRVT